MALKQSVTVRNLVNDPLAIGFFDNLALVESIGELAARRDRIPDVCRQDEYPIPLWNEAGGVAGGGDSLRSARKDGGRKSRLMIQRLQLKTAQAEGKKDAGRWKGKGESPAGMEVQRGDKTGRSARYSPSPQPLGLHDPQAGFAGARPSGKVKKSNGKRY